jgi:protein-tyrosine phosphatase
MSSYEATKSLGDLNLFGITHILNLADTAICPKRHSTITYQNLRIPDNAKVDILFCIYTAIRYIDEIVMSGENVLVHCLKGLSRAPTIVCAYLMWKEEISSQMAWEMMQQFEIDPNFGFLCQLKFFGPSENP